jgi:hypothetical protein
MKRLQVLKAVLLLMVWRTRDLNTIKTNTITGFFIKQSNYFACWNIFYSRISVSFRAEGNISRIYNITDSSQVSLGINNHSGSVTTGSQGTSTVSCIVTIAGTKVFELQQCPDNCCKCWFWY